jgi:RNA polymerase sigma factor (sigma-70 family)
VLAGSLLRLRSDEQLVAAFRGGNDEAFRVIHDRYRKRLLAYARQMLAGSGQDAEDALQDVFERAYSGLRATDRDLALKAWLYRVAHNRCIDQLRRPLPVAATEPDDAESRQPSPAALAEQRETLRRLIMDVQRLPGQQRSALLLREMSGLSYAELAGALGVSVPAVKSLLVRARIGLVAANEARETACLAIREELVLCHDRGVRPSGRARRHLNDCEQCTQFRRSVRGVSRNLTAIAPAVGPIGILIKLLSGGGAAGSSGMLGSGAAATGGTAAGVVAGGAVGAGAIVSTGAVAGGLAIGANHVTALLAALATASGALPVQHGPSQTHSGPSAVPAHHVAVAASPFPGEAAAAPQESSPVTFWPATRSSVTAAPAGSLTPAAKLALSGSVAGKSHSKKTRPSQSPTSSGTTSTGGTGTPSSSAPASTTSGTTGSSSSTAGTPSSSSSGSTTGAGSASGVPTGTAVSPQGPGEAALSGSDTPGGSSSTTSGSSSGS